VVGDCFTSTFIGMEGEGNISRRVHEGERRGSSGSGGGGNKAQAMLMGRCPICGGLVFERGEISRVTHRRVLGTR
jgi:hypothetical protein